MKGFWHLMERYGKADEAQKQDISKLLWDSFGVEACVMTLDMSGFSLSVRQGPLLDYLAQIRRMQLAVTPVVVRHGGEVVKFEADNMAAVFPTCEAAAAAAHELHSACRLASPVAGPVLKIALGLDWGRFLLISGQDLYGDCVNVAFKLGEDLARAGETLISEKVRSQLAPESWSTRSQEIEISGLHFTAYALEKRGSEGF